MHVIKELSTKICNKIRKLKKKRLEITSLVISCLLYKFNSSNIVQNKYTESTILLSKCKHPVFNGELKISVQ